MIEKTYEPSSVEGRIYGAWEGAGAFKAGAGSKPGAESYSVVIPPPNVTGSLHIGHALNNTIQDVLLSACPICSEPVTLGGGMTTE